ncbi:MAG: response regulator [Bacteroidota bacterium]|jgi:two-component system chemotaxis response regulator CheY
MAKEDLLFLVVDDSPTMRRIISNTLERIGYKNSIEAANGKEALQQLEGNEIQFIITDWNMPVMNGLEFVTEIRSDDDYKELPILMITTRGMKDDVLQAVHAGVNNYIVKPFTPETLEAKIGKLL